MNRSSEEPRRPRWHPRLTPFRLAIISTTAGLGITKAIFTSKGDAIYSTTVEWISGVVLALGFQFLGELESFNHRNAFGRFIFAYDCLNPLWKVYPRPSYSDDEREYRHLNRQAQVLVTPFRLCVCGVSVAFGLFKMICIYAGFSGAMNASEWLFSVPVSLILYWIGLYENNTVHLARNFFEEDYTPLGQWLILFGIYLVLSAGSLFLSLRWAELWYNAFTSWVGGPWTLNNPPPFYQLIPSWLHTAHDYSCITFASIGVTSLIVLGLLPFMLTTIMCLHPLSTGTVWIVKTIQRAPGIKGALARLKLIVQPAFQKALPVAFRLAVIVSHLVALVFFFSVGFFALGFGPRFYDTSTRVDTNMPSPLVVAMCLTVILGGGSFAAFWAAVQVMRSLLSQ